MKGESQRQTQNQPPNCTATTKNYEFCQQFGQPVYITKDGAVDLVILSRKICERLRTINKKNLKRRFLQ